MYMVRNIFSVVAIVFAFGAVSASAFEYDSGWLNLSGGDGNSRCVYSHNMPWVRACSVTEGAQGNSRAQWFVSDIQLPNFPFDKGTCQVTVRAAYTNNSGGADAREDFRLTINGRTVVVRDPNAAAGFDVRNVTVPGRFDFYRNWNRLYFAGDSRRGWAGSVWFGDYTKYAWGGDVLEAPGKRAIRIQCDDASQQGTTTTTPPQNPSVATCPYTDGIVVHFSGRLQSNVYARRYQDATANIPAGTYKVSLAAEDHYTGRENSPAVEQSQEQFFVELLSGATVLAQSGSTPDLRDGVASASWSGVVTPELTIGQDATVVRARHIVRNQYPNSLNPLCAQFLPADNPVCGNGKKERGEQCDDGNNDYTDGCTKYCKAAYCGDGYVRSGVEECDDGNNVNGDGCSSTCRVERVGGVCGSAAKTASCGAPTGGLCTSGVASAPAYNAATRKWEWTCGSGARSRSCSTPKRCGYVEIAP